MWNLALQVLIPVFALGRAQELCILLETYWDRMNLKVPIYFSMGLTEKVGHCELIYTCGFFFLPMCLTL